MPREPAPDTGLIRDAPPLLACHQPSPDKELPVAIHFILMCLAADAEDAARAVFKIAFLPAF